MACLKLLREKSDRSITIEMCNSDKYSIMYVYFLGVFYTKSLIYNSIPTSIDVLTSKNQVLCEYWTHVCNY